MSRAIAFRALPSASGLLLVMSSHAPAVYYEYWKHDTWNSMGFLYSTCQNKGRKSTVGSHVPSVNFSRRILESVHTRMTTKVFVYSTIVYWRSFLCRKVGHHYTNAYFYEGVRASEVNLCHTETLLQLHTRSDFRRRISTDCFTHLYYSTTVMRCLTQLNI